MANLFEINRTTNKIILGTTDTTINIGSHTASQLLGLDASKNLESVAIGADVQAWSAELDKVTDGDHDVIASGNPHSVTPTELGLVIGTNVQAYDAALTSVSGLVYVSPSFIKLTADDTYAVRTIAETKSDLSLNLVENTALSTWIGTLTEITTIDAAADFIPVLDATDSVHKKILPTNLGHRLVSRGDNTTADWVETGSKAVLNTDGTWRDLDCSAVVPAGAVAILFNISVTDDVANSYLQLRKNGNSNTQNVSSVITQVANIQSLIDTVVFCDANRVVEYIASNVAFSLIAIRIRGWWI